MSSLNSVTVYVYDDDFWTAKPVFGELHVLDDTEDTLHNAGYTSQYRNISFWVLDVTQYTNLETPYKNGTTVTFVDWLGNSSSVKIRDLKPDPMTDIKRPPDFAVFRCKAKLMKV